MKGSGKYMFGAVVVMIGIMALIALWTDRNMDFWISFFKNQPIDVPYWISFVLSIVLNGFIVLLNIVAEIAKYFI